MPRLGSCVGEAHKTSVSGAVSRGPGPQGRSPRAPLPPKMGETPSPPKNPLPPANLVPPKFFWSHPGGPPKVQKGPKNLPPQGPSPGPSPPEINNFPSKLWNTSNIWAPSEKIQAPKTYPRLDKNPKAKKKKNTGPNKKKGESPTRRLIPAGRGPAHGAFPHGGRGWTPPVQKPPQNPPARGGGAGANSWRAGFLRGGPGKGPGGGEEKRAWGAGAGERRGPGWGAEKGGYPKIH